MNNLSYTHTNYSERGSAGIKLLLVLLVIALIANAGYQYIPTAYNAESFKQDMETIVIQGAATPATYGKPADVIKRRLMKSITANGLPADAYINVGKLNEVLTARVFYVKTVHILPFGLYEYDFVFDHSATPGGFLTQ